MQTLKALDYVAKIKLEVLSLFFILLFGHEASLNPGSLIIGEVAAAS